VNQLPNDGHTNLEDLLQAAFPKPGAAAACDLGPGRRPPRILHCYRINGRGAHRRGVPAAKLSNPGRAPGAHYGRQPGGCGLAEGARRTGASREDRSPQPRAAGSERAYWTSFRQPIIVDLFSGDSAWLDSRAERRRSRLALTISKSEVISRGVAMRKSFGQGRSCRANRNRQ
jgi:hypothetical protein